VTKGDDPARDGYSAFDGTTGSGCTLLHDLRRNQVEHLYVGGLATDYCVKQSVMDARKAGFEVTVLTDAVRAVDLRPGDGGRAMEEMGRAGATFTDVQHLLESI
jgi:nicotinamidase/pyrazinamidase